MRRRIAILLVPAVSMLGAAAGTVLTAAPAHAEGTPIVQQSLIVNPLPQNHLLSVCLTSRSLIPDGACLVI